MDQAQIVRAIPAPAYACDLEGRIQAYNEAAIALWGRKPEVGERWHGAFRVYQPDGTPLAADQCPMAMAPTEGRSVRDVHLVVERPDGSRKHVISYSGAIRDSSGQIHGAINLLVDITEEVRDHELHGRLAAIVESSDDAIISKNLDGTIVTWNRGAQRIFGYTEEEAVGQSILMLVPKDREEEEREFLSRLRLGDRIDHIQTVRLTKDGREVYVSLTVSPVRDRYGKVIGASKVARDITDERRAEAALREAKEGLERHVAGRTAQLRAMALELIQAEHRERKRMAQTLHDDIQQLLVGVKIQASLALSHPGKTEPIREALRLAEETILACRSLVTGLSPPLFGDANLLDSLKWLSRRTAEQFGLQVEVIGEDSPPQMSEDLSSLFYEIARELLLNVVKHSGVKNAVLRVSHQDERLFLEVTDKGNGCPPERLSDGGNQSFGIFSIRERLAAIGGSVEITGAPGQGCHVRISAPLNATTVTTPKPTIAASVMQGTSSLAPGQGACRVLLVDDHPIVRQGLANLLASEPDIHVVAQASDGAQALALARRLKPDVVIMDISMPGMNGIEAARQIRSEMPDIRVIILSMHPHEDTASAVRDAGIDAYLEKDGPIERLIEALRFEARQSQPE